ncbi:cyclic AMP-dependent transcription factor ATF-4 [Acipenser ruthenus]|uniref:cyclic AMP-dependent transcription factor ATF-4 n=1 Tax=Acipenser ruthenus TaxID=7906 RepID=UPI0027404449|nr:cyclic AMP-dependent transcription factor ATF-4 [Acipenser ruthenus]
MTSSAVTSDLLDSLLWGSPSFLTAEPEGGGAGGLLLSGSGDDDDEMFQSHLKEFGSPSSSPLSPSSFFSSSSSSPSSSSLLQCPLGKAVEPLDWLLDPMAGDCTEDAFSGMDWMVQKMDLSELDLDSLMDPCDSGALPSPPEDLLSSLGGSCDLDLELGGYLASLTAEPHSDPSFIPEPPAEPEPPVAVETLQEAVTPGAGFVSEPLSSSSSSTPALEGQVEGHQSFSLELGSEVDIDEAQETRTEPVLLLWKQEAQTPETQLQTQETEPVLLLWKEEAQTMEIEGYCSSDTDSGRGSPERSPSPSSSSSSQPRKALSEAADHPSFSQELGCEIDIDSAQEALSEPGLLPWKREIEGYCSSDTDSGLGSSCGSPERSPPSSSSSSSSSSEPRRAAVKPYSRPTREEQEVCVSLSGHVKSTDKRKMKKMEQNKTAATRYRQKKRSELDRLRGEREALEEKNRALGERAEAIATEIRYLTELMREVREARGRRLQQGKGTE